MSVWVGADGKAYSHIGRWTNLDCDEWAARDYRFVAGYARGVVSNAEIEFRAPDDATALAICRQIVRRFPDGASDGEKECVRWARDFGWTLEVTYTVGEGKGRK